MKIFKPTKSYGYSIGAIRVLENELFSETDFDRMINASSAKEAYQVLNDTDFKKEIPKHEKVNEFEQTLEQSLLRTKNYLIDVTTSNNYISGIWREYDYFNLKLSFKAFFSQKDFETISEALSPLGLVDFVDIKSFVFDEETKLEYIPQEMIELKPKIIEQFEKSKNLREIDFMLDQAAFNYLFLWAKKSKEDLILNFVKKRIDLKNLISLIRLSEEELKKYSKFVFLANGNYSLKELKNLNPEEKLEFASQILELEEEKTKPLLEAKDYKAIQKRSEDLLNNFIEEMWFLNEGPALILVYWWTRKSTSQIIRNILVGKLNGLDNEEIRKYSQKLPDFI
jgi:V/A-type H+-transporting ATPase subunit C